MELNKDKKQEIPKRLDFYVLRSLVYRLSQFGVEEKQDRIRSPRLVLRAEEGVEDVAAFLAASFESAISDAIGDEQHLPLHAASSPGLPSFSATHLAARQAQNYRLMPNLPAIRPAHVLDAEDLILNTQHNQEQSLRTLGFPAPVIECLQYDSLAVFSDADIKRVASGLLNYLQKKEGEDTSESEASQGIGIVQEKPLPVMITKDTAEADVILRLKYARSILMQLQS